MQTALIKNTLNFTATSAGIEWDLLHYCYEDFIYLNGKIFLKGYILTRLLCSNLGAKEIKSYVNIRRKTKAGMGMGIKFCSGLQNGVMSFPLSFQIWTIPTDPNV